MGKEKESLKIAGLCERAASKLPQKRRENAVMPASEAEASENAGFGNLVEGN
jgi:hypothetical protein